MGRCYYNRPLMDGETEARGTLVADTVAPGSLFIANAAHRDMLKVLAELRGAGHHLFLSDPVLELVHLAAQLVQPVLLLQAHPALLAQLLEGHVQAVHLRLPPADLLAEGDRSGTGKGRDFQDRALSPCHPLPSGQGCASSEPSDRTEYPPHCPRRLHAGLSFLQVLDAANSALASQGSRKILLP